MGETSEDKATQKWRALHLRNGGRNFRVDSRALCGYRLHAHFQNGEDTNHVPSQDRTRRFTIWLPQTASKRQYSATTKIRSAHETPIKHLRHWVNLEARLLMGGKYWKGAFKRVKAYKERISESITIFEKLQTHSKKWSCTRRCEEKKKRRERKNSSRTGVLTSLESVVKLFLNSLSLMHEAQTKYSKELV